MCLQFTMFNQLNCDENDYTYIPKISCIIGVQNNLFVLNFVKFMPCGKKPCYIDTIYRFSDGEY